MQIKDVFCLVDKSNKLNWYSKKDDWLIIVKRVEHRLNKFSLKECIFDYWFVIMIWQRATGGLVEASPVRW